MYDRDQLINFGFIGRVAFQVFPVYNHPKPHILAFAAARCLAKIA